MKKIVATLSLMVFLAAIGPKKTQAQVLEGALIGGAVGGVVGLFLHFMKPDAAQDPEASTQTASSGRADADSSLVVKPVFLPGAEVIEEAESTAN